MASNCWSCSQDYYDVGVCTNAAEPNLPFNLYADDGEVYVEQAPSVWSALPFDVGALIASNGAADRVRYADWYPWTGDRLPEPTSCPTFTGFSICGGNCGPCGAGQLCTGRSPSHPFGLCLSDPTLSTSTTCDATHACPSGAGCVVLKSSSDGQPLADQRGICAPSASCQSIAANLPGGALCQAQ